MTNTTPVQAIEYDKEIGKTIPFYPQFYSQTIDLIKTIGFKNANWLDTGCGTGALIVQALKEFNDFVFILCDPSKEMMEVTIKNLKENTRVLDFCICSSQQLKYKNKFEIITALQVHHYLSYKDRLLAVENCFQALKKDGIYIFFENFAPSNSQSKEIGLQRWGYYQKEQGKSKEEVEKHLARYGKKYFPITIEEHIKILKNQGFQTVEIFWLSYLQVGIYVIK